MTQLDSGIDPTWIPLGSWDTLRIPNSIAQSDNHFIPDNDSLTPRPFLASENAELRDQRLVHALQLLSDLCLVSYRQLYLVNGEGQQGSRLLIYGIPNIHDTYRQSGGSKNRMGQRAALVRRAMAMVLLNMNVDPCAFNNASQVTLDNCNNRTKLFQGDRDKRLIDIYMEMPSPGATDDPFVAAKTRRSPSKTVERILERTINEDSPRGMRTKLYRYQKNSLWKLLRRELCSDFILDPAYIPVQDMNGNTYYIHMTNEELSICLRPSVVWDDVAGGIICEDMGTGKTCLCIALILQTLHQSSKPPNIEAQLHCDLYPYTHSSEALDQDDLFMDASRRILRPGTEIPSLRDLAAAALKMNSVDYEQARNFVPSHIMDLLNRTCVYYVDEHSSGNIRPARSKQFRMADQSPEVYLTSSTLVIVPSNLMAQWLNEINKHTEDSMLKVYSISSATNKEIPEPMELMRYNMVLISRRRFAKEYEPGAYSIRRAKGKSPCPCKARYVNCRCPISRSISPLMQIRWKRVIVDEGHSLGVKLSDHALLAERLHADRRWICTGTPTLNLANLKPSSSSSVQTSLTDKGDLERLSTLFGSFLHLHPYAGDKDLFARVIQKPLIDRHNIVNGTSNVAWSMESASIISRLRHLMNRIMIRNKITDVELDVTLPPLHERIVRLDLEYFQVLALNGQIALLQANAVLTEREDQDYYFHPSNRKHLARLIDNLEDSCFWYPGGNNYMEQLQGALKNVFVAIEKHLGSNGLKYTDNDAKLLIEICEHLQKALHDQSWKAIQATQEIGYYCRDLPRPVQETHALIPATRLGVALEAHKAASGATVDAGEGGSSGSTLQRHMAGHTGGSDQTCIMLAKQINRLRADVLKSGRASEATISGMQTEEMAEDNLSRATILSSTSSKLNYIVSQILRHHNSEKCIVFCQSLASMYYIYEYLSLAKVRCLLYTTHGLTESERSDSIMTFNTSENVSAFIMDTKHAAFGIDLSSASRVYFVSPVWQTATMRQAVKRAHRIGQVRPVYVETLVIKDSFEEAILNRRREIDRGEESEPTYQPSNPVLGRNRKKGKERYVENTDPASKSVNAKNMMDDYKMRDVLSDISFMPLPQWATTNASSSPSSSCTVPSGSQESIGLSHVYPTLRDYIALQEGQSSDHAQLEIPVILPRKESDHVAQLQSPAQVQDELSATDWEMVNSQEQGADQEQHSDPGVANEDFQEFMPFQGISEGSMMSMDLTGSVGDPQGESSLNGQGNPSASTTMEQRYLEAKQAHERAEEARMAAINVAEQAREELAQLTRQYQAMMRQQPVAGSPQSDSQSSWASASTRQQVTQEVKIKTDIKDEQDVEINSGREIKAESDVDTKVKGEIKEDADLKAEEEIKLERDFKVESDIKDENAYKQEHQDMGMGMDLDPIIKAEPSMYIIFDDHDDDEEDGSRRDKAIDLRGHLGGFRGDRKEIMLLSDSDDEDNTKIKRDTSINGNIRKVSVTLPVVESIAADFKRSPGTGHRDDGIKRVRFA
ncbi:hypothetical protein BG011_000469 [Mortierella polycephala]|uniref:Uncharacterized protein n=1 Tax=Mortierella polycephala TaxID=41804 RepID=A0A9P6U9U4_9FUNG|nr:hypothetical protein BG011_000469 [Mortierella polycephala]